MMCNSSKPISGQNDLKLLIFFAVVVCLLDLKITKLKKETLLQCSYSHCSMIVIIPTNEFLLFTFCIVPPEIDSAPSALYQVVEGIGVILFCNATGNPQPTITWTKQGNNSILSTSKILNLTKLMREDDGSVYKCTVTNYVGSAEATAKITVWCKYMLQLYTYLAKGYF